MGYAQAAADVLGVLQQTLQFVVGGFGRGELVHLHFVELMAALDASRVPPGRHLFPAEAGRVGHVVEGQRAWGQDLVAVEVGQRDLGRADEPDVVLHVVVDVI